MINDQERAVTRAIQTIRFEGTFELSQLALIEQYFNYLYTIGFTHGRRQIHKGSPVATIEFGKITQAWPSIGAAARATGLDRNNISKTATGIVPRCGGKKWKFITEQEYMNWWRMQSINEKTPIPVTVSGQT
jgi:hypothetical protein